MVLLRLGTTGQRPPRSAISVKMGSFYSALEPNAEHPGSVGGVLYAVPRKVFAGFKASHLSHRIVGPFFIHSAAGLGWDEVGAPSSLTVKRPVPTPPKN